MINFAEPGLARTSDNVLHVVWHRPVAALREDLVHSAISPAGAVVGNPVTIQGGWNSLNQRPDLVVSPDGNSLRLFFAGLHSTTPGDPLNGGQLLTVTAGRDGRTWSAPQRATAGNYTSYASSGIGAGIGRNGTVSVSAGDPGNFFRVGGGPEFRYETGNYVYDPDIGVDSVSGQAVLAWFSNVNNNNGLYAQAIGPGGLVGGRVYLPGSANANRTTANQPIQRTPVTGRIGADGVYLAYGPGYPTRSRVNLLRFGGQPLAVGRGNSIENVNIAPAPEGRLWIMWSDRGRLTGRAAIHAVRTNRRATRVGTPATIAPPAGTVSVFGVHGEGSLGTLDLFAMAGNATNGVALWHTQVLPTLELEAKGGNGVVTVKVTDAGDPVAGVIVVVAGKKGVTNSRGAAKIKVQQRGAVTAKASKRGYKADKDRTRVKQKRR